jgi:Gamma-glutamyltranspeptidase
VIHLDSTMPIATAGDFEQPNQSHTTHLNVVDSNGNIVALTQTLGAEFGSGVIAGDTGILFSNEMQHLHPHLCELEPSRGFGGSRITLNNFVHAGHIQRFFHHPPRSRDAQDSPRLLEPGMAHH